MCGIVGYVGQRNARDVVVDALRRMDDALGGAVMRGPGVRSPGALYDATADVIARALDETDDGAFLSEDLVGCLRNAEVGLRWVKESCAAGPR